MSWLPAISLRPPNRPHAYNHTATGPNTVPTWAVYRLRYSHTVVSGSATWVRLQSWGPYLDSRGWTGGLTRRLTLPQLRSPKLWPILAIGGGGGVVMRLAAGRYYITVWFVTAVCLVLKQNTATGLLCNPYCTTATSKSRQKQKGKEKEG